MENIQNKVQSVSGQDIEAKKKHAAYMKEYYKRNPEKRKAWKKWFRKWRKTDKDYHKKYREPSIILLKSKRREREEFAIREKMKPCTDCGIMFPPWIMQFDHRDKEKKEGNIGELVRHTYDLELIKREIDKCDIVCANCHAERTHQEAKRPMYNLNDNMWRNKGINKTVGKEGLCVGKTKTD